jgi:membrane protein DedA with SNARE-associated domain
MERLGYLGVAGLTALENLIPPIPSEAILPLAGFLISQGRFSFAWVMFAATFGSVAGAVVLYYFGYIVGEHRIRYLANRYGRYILIDQADFDNSLIWFIRHGGKAVLIGRVVPGVRSLISIPAGLSRMRLGKFLLYTTAGSAVWNALLVGLGWGLGTQWYRIEAYVEVIQYGVVAAILAGLAFFFVRRWRSREAKKRLA